MHTISFLNIHNNSTHAVKTRELKEMHIQGNILMLSWEFPPNIIGGLARHVYGLSGSLDKIGFEIHIITSLTKDLPLYEKLGKVHVYRVKPYNDAEDDFLTWVGGLNIAIVEKARELVLNHRFELIHAHDWLASAAAISIKESFGIPLIATIHATEYGRNNGIFTEMQKFIHKKENALVHFSDHIIVCSNAMRDEVKQLFAAEEHQISVIPNGIDFATSKHRRIAAIKYPPIKKQGRMIFSMGRIVQEKGFDVLIQAAMMLRRTNPDVFFIIAGNGPMLETYRLKVKELKLDDLVFFIGFINDETRNALLAKCEMAVFPSRYEPFGIVALESMILGIPTIVSNVGGLKGIVDHLETGLIMETNSPKSFAEQVRLLLNNQRLAKRLGQKGKKVIRELYSWERAAKKTSIIYRRFTKK